MKRKVFYSAIAAMMACNSATAQERIHEIVFDSDRPIYDYSGRIVVNDIDSITFDVKNQRVNVFGSVNGSMITAWYDLAKLNGFSFTYLNDGVMPSTMLNGKIVDRNNINLTWRPVEGAAGYLIAYKKGIWEDFIEFEDGKRYVSVGPDVTEVNLHDLEYYSEYSFAIKVLSQKYVGRDSEWSTRCDFTDIQSNEVFLTTEERGNLPMLIAPIGRDYNSITLKLDTETTYDASTLDPKLEIVDGKCVYDKLMVQEQGGEKSFIDITDAHRAAGEIVVDGLKDGACYTFALYNSHLKPVDAPYKPVTYRTKGTPGAPILIQHKVASKIWIGPPFDNLNEEYLAAEQEYQACRIDTVFTNYNSDINLVEGQTFMLEGGKVYYIRQHTSLLKGFTLCTDPADLAAGKGRAKVYMGGIVEPKTSTQVGVYNWQIGKAKAPGEFDAPIYIDKIIFRDIDFDVPLAQNRGMAQENGGNIATGNYWMNSYNGTVPFEYESIECHNCTFQHFVRGFMRFQGAGKKVVNKIVYNNCVFMNLGMYDANGMNYRFIHGEQINKDDNVAKDIQITNNTFYDCTLSHMVSPTKDKVVDFPSSYTPWSVRIEGNTFINLSTRAGRPFINMRSFPGDSKFTFKRNLICLAKDDADQRDLKQGGIDLRPVISGSGMAYFDVCDNYSTGCLDKHMVDDGIFTSGALSLTKNSFGFFAQQGMLAPELSADDLVVKVGSTPLRTDELFADPNPKYHATSASDVHKDMHYIDPATIWSRLKYNNDLKVTQHEIYTRNIGDQRWKSLEPEFFMAE